MAYQLVALDDDLGQAGVIESYDTLTVEQTWNGPGTWEVDLDPAEPAVQALLASRLARVVGLDPVLVVEQVQRDTDTGLLRVSGGDVADFLTRRLVIPPGGSSHDSRTGPAETRMKGYVDDHAGPSAVAARQLPGLTIAADLGRGASGTTDARYQPLPDVLREISSAADVGWQVRWDDGGLQFDVIVGEDRTGEVILDLELDAVLAQRLLSTVRDLATVVYVGGFGAGAARVIRTVETSPAPAGFDRREAFVNADDTADTDALDERGAARLAEGTEDVLETDVDPAGPFRIGRDFHLGDLLIARNRSWDVTVTSRVVGVRHELSASGLDVQVSLGRTWPTIADRLTQPTPPRS